MDWQTVAPILLDVFSQLAADPIEGVPEFKAQWKGRSEEMMSAEYSHALFLKVTRIGAVGEDEMRFDFDPLAIDPTNGLLGVETATASGMRKVTLQLKSECNETTDALWAMGILDRIATRIVFPRYWDRLRDEANVSFFDWEDAVDHGVPKDGREVSVATMDLYFYMGINERDPVPYGWIESVVISTHFASSTDVTNVVVPPDPPA